MLRVTAFWILLLSLCGLLLSAQENSITFSELTLANSFGESTSMTLSPDGTILAWAQIRDGICVRYLADEVTTCTPFPTDPTTSDEVDLYDNTSLKWSPDNSMIALTENWTQNFRESDLWLFDVNTLTYRNSTDDTASGSAIMLDQQDTPYFLDATPIWNPVTGDLYFFRYERDGRTYTTALYRLPRLGGNFAGIVQGESGLAQGEPELVTELSDLPPLSVYDGNTFNLEGGAAISPDGTTLAFLSRPAQAERSAVWLVDLQTGTVTSAIAFADIQGTGLPAWYDMPMLFSGISWIDDDSLLISTSPIGALRNTIEIMLYRYDLSGETLSPILDFSDVPDEQTFLNSGDYETLRSAVISPLRDGVFAFDVNQTTRQVDLSFIPFDDPSPQLLHDIPYDEYQFGETRYTSAGISGSTIRVLLSGYIFELEVEPTP